MYPKKLPNHSTATFRLEEKHNNEQLRRAYYHRNDYPINMHSHNFYEINIVVEGTGAHYIENISIPISPGDVFAIPPKSHHGYWSENDLNIFHLILPHYVLEKYENELQKFRGYNMLFEIEPWLRKNSTDRFFLHLREEELKELQHDMDGLISVSKEETVETNTLFELRAVLLVCTLSRLLNRDGTDLSPDTYGDSAFIVKTLKFMNENYYEKITVDELASMANMSRSTYLRRFASVCKTSPMEYLAELRVKKACLLLKNGELSITDIAQNCGFFDCSHFIRVFSRLRGTTPNSYRKNILTRY